MTDNRFDELTKTLGRSASRRAVVKGLLAAALGAALTGVAGQSAGATRSRRACSRLRQDCGGANPACCAGLACDADATCCVPDNGACLADADCCGADVCRPNPAGLGMRCLPPGAVGARCVEDADCAAGLACAPASGACLVADGEPCATPAECASGVCDPYTATCVACAAGGDSCASNLECCSGICDEVTGQCLDACIPVGATCAEDNDCCSGACNWFGSVCLPAVPCNGGTDPESGAPWTLCRADFDSAWLSSIGSGGLYHAEQICRQIGYSTLGRHGGACGETCSRCVGGTSCGAPGTETYDTGGSCGSDANGVILCQSVMWECLA